MPQTAFNIAKDKMVQFLAPFIEDIDWNNDQYSYVSDTDNWGYHLSGTEHRIGFDYNDWAPTTAYYGAQQVINAIIRSMVHNWRDTHTSIHLEDGL